MKILKAHNLDVTYTYNIDVEKNNCIKYFFWFWNVIDVKLADDMLNMKAPMIPLFFLNQIPCQVFLSVLNTSLWYLNLLEDVN